MKKSMVLMFVCFSLVNAKAQDSIKTSVKVAVFAPIMIDEVFNGTSFSHTGNSLPKNVLPGLDFYNGVMMAIDSLQAEKAAVEVFIFDSKSKTVPIDSILKKPIWKKIDFIIVSFKDRNEIKPLADFALQLNIPLLSVTYPNDGGVNNNPNFIMVNSTLKTHVEGLYKYTQKNYSTANLVYVKRKGSLEDLIQGYFVQMGKMTPGLGLKYKAIELVDSFSQQELYKHLDSTKQNVVICGSINEAYGIRLAKTLTQGKSFTTTVIGMPTWDGVKDFTKLKSSDKNKPFELIFSTPYNFNRAEGWGKKISTAYNEKFYARASDWALKGFESVYHFVHLYLKYPNGFMKHLSDKSFTVCNEFDFQPIKLKKENADTDYLENKKLYFIKMVDGVIKSVN